MPAVIPPTMPTTFQRSEYALQKRNQLQEFLINAYDLPKSIRDLVDLAIESAFLAGQEDVFIQRKKQLGL